MLSYDLSDEQRLFRDTVREFAEGEIGPVAEELDREGGSRWSSCAAPPNSA